MTIQNFNKKVFVSYNGGSGGDLFVTSCNGMQIDLRKNKSVRNKNSTIKSYEQDLINGTVTLESCINDIDHTYISTHLFVPPLINSGHDMVNIVIKDLHVQEKIYNRKMEMQILRIDVNVDHYWFKLVRDWCLLEKYNTAAKYWYELAKKNWRDSMQVRISENQIPQLNFDKLFTSDWSSSLSMQGWNHNIAIANKNHEIWLGVNLNFSKESTIFSMENKLKTMDWTQKSGTIQYKNPVNSC
jgi:hypothetical protein